MGAPDGPGQARDKVENNKSGGGTRPRRQRPQAARRDPSWEAARTARGRVSRRVRMDSSGGRPRGSTWVAPPTDR